MRGTVSRDLVGLKFEVKIEILYGEFDPGSERTLAACLTHASQGESSFGDEYTGARVSNT